MGDLFDLNRQRVFLIRNILGGQLLDAATAEEHVSHGNAAKYHESNGCNLLLIAGEHVVMSI